MIELDISFTQHTQLVWKKKRHTCYKNKRKISDLTNDILFP